MGAIEAPELSLAALLFAVVVGIPVGYLAASRAGGWLDRVFVAGSLLWGVVADGFRPDRWDIGGALVCLVGVAVIMYAPRGA